MIKHSQDDYVWATDDYVLATPESGITHKMMALIYNKHKHVHKQQSILDLYPLSDRQSKTRKQSEYKKDEWSFFLLKICYPSVCSPDVLD